ncbi:hypothetical protein [Jannaschia seohaensis]|uniref:Uncharacterized protein n=1 Tax=Jannaschia seohaensis TaxID=475081 RepID=A0A2Y9APD0_9RHOB|nr:hypothetical protein [Jannaschia seohaensis]PWJ20267.1 hypothetical protein BCF38_10382 [Jannaschia seohaensis]SSA44277.1 hypothetical protein SAMN05421539_10382 [Jannaschia seohaensis]
MTQSLVHFLMSGALIAIGIYLFDHPKLQNAGSRLFRGVVVWIVLVLGLRALDYAFLP